MGGAGRPIGLALNTSLGWGLTKVCPPVRLAAKVPSSLLISLGCCAVFNSSPSSVNSLFYLRFNLHHTIMINVLFVILQIGPLRVGLLLNVLKSSLIKSLIEMHFPTTVEARSASFDFHRCCDWPPSDWTVGDWLSLVLAESRIQ